MAGIWRRKRAKRDVWIVDCRDAAGMRHRLTVKTREQAEGLLADKITESRDAPPRHNGRSRNNDRGIRSALARHGRSRAQAADCHKLPSAFPAPRRTGARNDEVARDPTGSREKLGDAEAPGRPQQEHGAADSRVPVSDARRSHRRRNSQGEPAPSMSRRPGRKSADALSRSERLKTIRPMSENQLAAILDAAREDPEYYPWLLTLARTGLRPGEALALRWEDLNLSGRVDLGRAGPFSPPDRNNKDRPRRAASI